MDRLSAVIALALGALATLGACGKSDSAAPPLPSRAEGAKVNAGQKASTAAFCDFHKADDSGPLLQLPALGEYKITSKPGAWTWLNVWATWCKPCVDEMPRLAAWTTKLEAGGKQIDLEFVSIDETDDQVAAYQKLHHDPPHTARILDQQAKETWFKQLGLDAGAPIPIHVFVSPTGHIRCARAGSVREQDLPAIELLLAE
ncbi:MAG: TlpA disulfide reductase family protein [Kofleriaceae bacterium]